MTVGELKEVLNNLDNNEQVRFILSDYLRPDNDINPVGVVKFTNTKYFIVVDPKELGEYMNHPKTFCTLVYSNNGGGNNE
jgi:hypothetical protein